MKRILLAALTAVACAYSAHAKDVGLGLKAGLGVPFQANLRLDATSLDKEFSAGHNVGFHAGAFLAVRLPLVGLGIQPELLYVRQSVAYIDINADNKFTRENKGTSYLEIPINITWGVNLPKFHPFIVATPFFRYAFSNIKTYITDKQASLKKSDYGIGVGVGVDLFEKLQLMARYNWGLNKLVENSNYRINFLTVSVGWIFL